MKTLLLQILVVHGTLDIVGEGQVEKQVSWQPVHGHAALRMREVHSGIY